MIDPVDRPIGRERRADNRAEYRQEVANRYHSFDTGVAHLDRHRDRGALLVGLSRLTAMPPTCVGPKPSTPHARQPNRENPVSASAEWFARVIAQHAIGGVVAKLAKRSVWTVRRIEARVFCEIQRPCGRSGHSLG